MLLEQDLRQVGKDVGFFVGLVVGFDSAQAYLILHHLEECFLHSSPGQHSSKDINPFFKGMHFFAFLTHVGGLIGGITTFMHTPFLPKFDFESLKRWIRPHLNPEQQSIPSSPPHSSSKLAHLLLVGSDVALKTARVGSDVALKRAKVGSFVIVGELEGLELDAWLGIDVGNMVGLEVTSFMVGETVGFEVGAEVCLETFTHVFDQRTLWHL